MSSVVTGGGGSSCLVWRQPSDRERVIQGVTDRQIDGNENIERKTDEKKDG